MPLAPISNIVAAGAITLSGTTVLPYSPVKPVRLLRTILNMAVTTTTDDTVCTIGTRRTTGGALTPTGEGAGGTLTVPVGSAPGTVVYKTDNTAGGLVIYPGEQITLTPDGGAGAGSANVWYEFEELSFSDAQQRRDDHPGSTTNPTPLTNAVEVTS